MATSTDRFDVGTQSEAMDASGAGLQPRRSRRSLVAGACAVVLIGALVATLVAARSGPGDRGDGVAAPTAVAVAEVRDLVRTETFDGRLGFGAAQELAAARAGVLTAVADAGATIEPGDVAYSVDLVPTVVLDGAVPAYRALSDASADGPDVKQLEQALVDLGIAPNLAVDERFTSATAAAVEQWEEKLGRASPDGTVELGDVVFTDGPVRVATRVVDVGASVQDGSRLLTYTSTDKVVTLDLDADRSGIIAVGAAVTITLPDGTQANGTVSEIGAETEAAGAGAAPTVPVTITIEGDAAAGLDTGRVDVAVERSRVDDVVAVPVAALLALAEGGYAVELVDDEEADGSRLVAVEVGAFADGWVQVDGDGITAGTKIVVAA